MHLLLCGESWGWRRSQPEEHGQRDERAFPPYPQGHYAWARRGSEEVQIQMRGNEKQSYTVTVAVTVDGLKLPLSTIVRGKTVRSEWGLDLDPGRLEGPRTPRRGGRRRRPCNNG
jgi:hypothetical protein